MNKKSYANINAKYGLTIVRPHLIDIRVINF